MKQKSNLFKKVTATLITILGAITIICATPYNLNDKNEDCYDLGDDEPIECPSCTKHTWTAYGRQIGDILYVSRIECNFCGYETEFTMQYEME